MPEIVPVVDFDSMVVKAWAERRWAEQNGLCRLTTLLMPVRSDGAVAVQVRPLPKRAGGKRDFFGGGVCLEKETCDFLLGHSLDVGALVFATAIREANEELRMVDGSGLPELLNAVNARKYLFQVEDLGSFPWEREQRSTLYLVRIPADSSIRPMDDIEGIFVAVETKFYPLETILQMHKEQPSQFADGAERVLRRFQEDEALLRAVRQMITDVRSQI